MRQIFTLLNLLFVGLYLLILRGEAIDPAFFPNDLKKKFKFTSDSSKLVQSKLTRRCEGGDVPEEVGVRFFDRIFIRQFLPDMVLLPAVILPGKGGSCYEI